MGYRMPAETAGTGGSVIVGAIVSGVAEGVLREKYVADGVASNRSGNNTAEGVLSPLPLGVASAADGVANSWANATDAIFQNIRFMTKMRLNHRKDVFFMLVGREIFNIYLTHHGGISTGNLEVNL